MRAATSLFLLACVPAQGFVPAPSARFVGTTAGLTQAHQRAATTSAPLRMTAAGDGDKKAPWEAFTKDIAKKFAVAATVAAVAFSSPGDALAARSGGRMGGRSFSSPSVSPRVVRRVYVRTQWFPASASKISAHMTHGTPTWLFVHTQNVFLN